MNILFFFGNVLADVGDFIVVGFVAGQRSDIEFVLQDPLYSCVIPQIFQADFRLVVPKVLPKQLFLIVGRRLDPFLIKDTGYDNLDVT